MMAVDSKHGGNGTASAGSTLTGVPSASATLTGMTAANGTGRRRRASSLLAVASSLPSMETSLEEFIARANQTMVDASTWDRAEKEARQEDDRRKEADALRMKAAEGQLREGEVREVTLRRQLDGLQGKLAEAEARVAVALSSSGSFQQQSVTDSAELSDLRTRVAHAEERAQDAEGRAAGLSQALVAAKQEVAARPSIAFPSVSADDDHDERVRVAEAKAAKAIAAARAAAVGLTVSPADLAAIESGLVVPSMVEPKGTPWLAIAGAFLGGIVVMFAVAKLVLKDGGAAQPQTPAVATPTQPQQPAAQPPAQPATKAAPSAPSHATVTPIDEPPPANTVKVEPIDTAAEPAAPDPKAAAAEPAKKEPAKAAAAPVRHAAPVVHRPAPAPAKKADKGGIVDPFAQPAKKSDAAPAAKDKKAGGLVDPF